jgi:hypothetical protein
MPVDPFGPAVEHVPQQDLQALAVERQASI